MTDLPILIAFGSLKGANKKDVESKCRGFIENYFESPANCHFFYKKIGDVTYYEIQEGGNQKAYLPSIIKYLKLDKEVNVSDEINIDEDDGDEEENLKKPESVYAYVPSAKRMAYVEKRADHISFGIATSDISPTLEPTPELKRTAKMTPYKNESNGLLMVGIASFMMGFSTLISAYIVKINSSEIIIDEKTNHLRELSKQINDIENIKSVLPNNYIKKLEYDGEKWIKKTGNILVENNLKKESEIIEKATNNGDEKSINLDDLNIDLSIDEDGNGSLLPKGVEPSESDVPPPPPKPSAFENKKPEVGGRVDTFEDAKSAPPSEIAKDNKIEEMNASEEEATKDQDDSIVDSTSQEVETDSGDKITVVIENKKQEPETIEEIRESIDEEKEGSDNGE